MNTIGKNISILFRQLNLFLNRELADTDLTVANSTVINAIKRFISVFLLVSIYKAELPGKIEPMRQEQSSRCIIHSRSTVTPFSL